MNKQIVQIGSFESSKTISDFVMLSTFTFLSFFPSFFLSLILTFTSCTPSHLVFVSNTEWSQVVCFFQGRPCLFQQYNAKSHPASITAARLHRGGVQVLNWTLTNRKHLVDHIIKNPAMHQTKMKQHSFPKTPATGLLISQMLIGAKR